MYSRDISYGIDGITYTATTGDIKLEHKFGRDTAIIRISSAPHTSTYEFNLSMFDIDKMCEAWQEMRFAEKGKPANTQNPARDKVILQVEPEAAAVIIKEAPDYVDVEVEII